MHKSPFYTFFGAGAFIMLMIGTLELLCFSRLCSVTGISALILIDFIFILLNGVILDPLMLELFLDWILEQFSVFILSFSGELLLLEGYSLALSRRYNTS
jgi:hypothetical protein